MSIDKKDIEDFVSMVLCLAMSRGVDINHAADWIYNKYKMSSHSNTIDAIYYEKMIRVYVESFGISNFSYIDEGDFPNDAEMRDIIKVYKIMSE